MFDFTNRVKRIINEYAPKEAKRLGHDYIGPEHILLGLLRANDSVALKMLHNLGVDLNDLRKEVEKRCEADGATLVIDPTHKDRVQKILEFSREEARKLRHSYIGSEHILLALLRDQNSIAAQALGAFSITYQIIRNEINNTLGLGQAKQTQQNVRKEPPKTPMLDEYARNLTKMAEQNLIDPVIGRDREIDRVIQILSRKTKNNPILIGEAGVGKTAIVEGLAQRIVQKKVPEPLLGKRIYALDVAALIAGTKYRGEFEDRIKKIMRELQQNKDVILFIDEVHTIIGAGAAEGAVDAANILKPALARGEIQCIGATTLKEHKKYIEKDSALERRFQTVMVEEPSIPDAIRILAGLRRNYERHHAVKYTKESIVAAVTLSARYINGRYLPDKAIDLIDEAGARARLQSATIPEDIKKAEQEIVRLTREKNEMVRIQEYEKAARLRDQIVQIEKEMADRLEKWRLEQREKPLIITARDIEEIVSQWTGIPVGQLTEMDTSRLKNMEEALQKRVVGQRQAIEQISRAVRRSRSGLKSPKRPIGSFIFLGPTGVGKTELAKALAEFLFGKEDALIRFDMSEFMEPHSVSKFIGSPPGYVGYDEGGQLTEAVRRKPHSIVLFDEIEKAHHDIQNILLQILDEGALTDSMGRRVSFRETIIILTSNLGARQLQKGGKVGFSEDKTKEDSKKEQVLEELRRYFSPEFLNRIDEVIVFDSLKKEDVYQIVNLLLKEINRNALHKGVYLTLSQDALEYLAEKGYDEKYGARPLRRLMQREIEDEIALQLLDGRLKPPCEVKIKKAQDKLAFRSAALTEERLEKLKQEYQIPDTKEEDFWKEEDEPYWYDDPEEKEMNNPPMSLFF